MNYIQLYEKDILADRAGLLENHYRKCSLCPHMCKVDRTAGEKGRCNASALMTLASYGIHYGEEKPISGTKGSGTIFFSHCTLSCVFCQNHNISQSEEGHVISVYELAIIMLELQKRGAHNINLVTPTHFLPDILKSLEIAIEKGLRIPLVYNTSGFENVSVLKSLEGIVDIYMPDYKFSSAKLSQELCGSGKIPSVTLEAIKEMNRQVGKLFCGPDGVAVRGLLVRHLVMPGFLENTEKVLKNLSRTVPDVTVSILTQYRPAFKAPDRGDTLSRILEMNERDFLKDFLSTCSLNYLQQD